MKRYESRYCTFAVPDDWVPLAPFGFAGPGDEEDRMAAQAMERWLREPIPAADHAKQQLRFMPLQYDEFALVQDGGSFLLFRFRNEEGDHTLGKVIYLTIGPLACELTLLGLDGPDKERDRLFEAIGKTFALRDVDFLAKIEKKPLLTPGVAAALAGERRKYPRACVSLPTPPGWDVAYEDGVAVFRRSGAQIRLQRVLGSDGDGGAWFKQRMENLQDTKSLLFTSEKGALERGKYAALLYEEKGATRTWSSAAVKRSLDVFVSDEQPLLWTLNANVAGFDDHRPVLESLVAATEFLPSAEWETKLAEPWIDLTLKGPWRTEGPGLYVTTKPAFTYVYLMSHKERSSIETLRDSAVGAIKRGAGLQQLHVEEEAVGSWKGHEAFRLSFESVSSSADTQLIRTTWIKSNSTLYNCVLQSQDRHTANELFTALLNSLSLERPGH